MKFRTEIEPLQKAGTISHGTPLMFIGSCFAENIGNRLADRMFDVEINPFGTMYNPLSVASSLHRIADCRRFTATDLVESRTDGLIHSFHLHSRFSHKSEAEVLKRANEAVERSNEFLQRASWLCVTLGTSWCFVHKPSKMTVANCHKFPGNEFERRFISPEESTATLQKAFEKVREINPSIKLLLTVSPIRHLADGLHGNTISKAALLLACEAIKDAIYFPSYEILIDDLRDYRFYAQDMKHPSEAAIDYIFEIFSRSFFDAPTITLAEEAWGFMRRLRHRQITQTETDYSVEASILLKNFISRNPSLEGVAKKITI